MLYHYLLNRRREQRKDSFYPNTLADFTHRESLAISTNVPSLDNGTLKLLDTLLIALRDFSVYTDRVPCLKMRENFSTLAVSLLNKFYQGIHSHENFVCIGDKYSD